MASLAATPASLPRGARLAAAGRRLAPGEGWTTVLLHVVVLLAAAWTVQRADWAPDRVVLAIVSLGGLALGLGLGKLRAPDLLAHLLAFWSGIAVVVGLTVDRMDAIPSRRERLLVLWAQAEEWYRRLVGRGGIDDERLFVVVMALTIWLVAYTSAWVLYRRGWLTTALVLPGIIAVVNLGYAPEAGSAPLLVYVVAACLLAARHHAYRREREWARAGTPRPSRLPWRFLGAGANLTLLVALLGWNLPASGRATLFDAAWTRLEPPVMAVEERWEDLIGDLGGGRRGGGGSYASFNDSFRLGGRLDLSDEEVVLLQSGERRPTYLVGHRYNVYDGHGWASDAEDGFVAVDETGNRYSSEMTFRPNQRLLVSPAVSNRRSEVTATLTALRPKGNLLFTTDTFLAVDRKANVRLSWRQLRDERFPIQTDQIGTAIPVDLREIVLLLRDARFAPDPAAAADPAPAPTDPALARQIAAERRELDGRFLDVGWEADADGRATDLVVDGQIAIYDDVEAVFGDVAPAANESYGVTGLLSTAEPVELRQAGTGYPDQVRDRYLEFPDTVTQRTRDLATRLRADRDNPFDVAVAVQNYVRDAIAYDENITAPPSDQDVVDYVLFESKRGYCEYYASAMAVMLRTLDIPARVVGGYFPAPDPELGGYLYREKNAHLWVEVYFPGYGWIPFEPTASQRPLSYGDPAPEAEPTATPAADASPTPDAAGPAASPTPPPSAAPIADDRTPFAGSPGPLGWATLGVGLLLAVIALGAAALWFWTLRGLTPTGGFYARAVRAGRWLGLRPSPATTPSEYADRLGRAVPPAGRPARVVADLYNRELYGDGAPEPAAARSARAAWGDLRRALLRARLGRRPGGSGGIDRG